MLVIVTLAVAIAISAVAAYYSILGLTAMFAAAFWSVAIMGTVLEAGKITAAVWLHANWQRATRPYKLYLVPAVVVLMLLTSMGIFGFLSKAHLDQAIPLGDVAQKVSILDERIQQQRDTIGRARQTLAQLDASVDQLLSRTTTDAGVDRSTTLRRQQSRERQQLQQEIQQAQTEIQRLSQERAPIASQLRQVEAEVGPVKYVAQLIYGDAADKDLLERAVRWIIIMIVFVFDPLAVALILAAQRQWMWDRQVPKDIGERIEDHLEDIQETQEDIEETQDDIEDVQEDIEDGNAAVVGKQQEVIAAQEQFIQDQNTALDELRLILSDTLNGYEFLENQTRTQADEIDQLKLQIEQLAGKNQQVLLATAQQENSRLQMAAGFGIQFPLNPNRGDCFLRIDRKPGQLYLWNGARWVEVDRSVLNGSQYNSLYLDYLRKQLDYGAYHIADLDPTEIEQLGLDPNTMLTASSSSSSAKLDVSAH